MVSRRTMATKRIAKRTLSLSIGATRDASPSCKARKYQSQERPVATPDNPRKSHVRNEMVPKDQCDRVKEAISQVKRRITVVRIAVAKFESIAVTPILARTAVAPAKRAERSDQASQLFIYASRLHFDACFFFERLDQGRGVFCSEAKVNGRAEIFFNNAQRRNGRLQACPKSFNQACVLEHELECKAGGKIALQNVFTIAYEKR